MISKMFMLFLLLGLVLSIPYDENQRQFPKNFIFGRATSAYQTEGAWNASGDSHYTSV